MSSPQPYPRSVTPGIETHLDTPRLLDPGIYVGLDWIRCTGPESLRMAVESLLHERFVSEPRTTRGAQWFRAGIVWEPGVMLSWEHRAGICQVDIQGQRLRLMDGGDRVQLLGELMCLGMKPTRLDGALDWIGQGVNGNGLGVCEAATEACRRGELCVLRKFRLNDEFTAQGMPSRRHLNLGSRESPVCARVYDKGLEQRVAPPGYWERFEAEFKGDRAPRVAKALTEAGDGWPGLLTGLILGAVDFRESNGRSELDRRPRAEWWAELTAGTETVRIPPAQDDKSFERWWGWFRTAVGPRLLEFTDVVGWTLGETASWLLEGVEARPRGGLVVAGFAQCVARDRRSLPSM